MKYEEKVKKAFENIDGGQGQYCNNPEEHGSSDLDHIVSGDEMTIYLEAGDPHHGVNICSVCLSRELKNVGLFI